MQFLRRLLIRPCSILMEYLAEIIQVNNSIIISKIIFDFSGKKNCEKVAALLSATYPALFKYDEKESFGKAPTMAGYGLGGVKGLKNFSSTLCARVHAIILPPVSRIIMF